MSWQQGRTRIPGEWAFWYDQILIVAFSWKNNLPDGRIAEFR